MRKTPFVVALLVLALPLLSHANVVYSFSGFITSLNQPDTFTLTVPYYITTTGTTGLTPDASFVPGGQLVCSVCTRIDFYVDALARGFTDVPSNTVGYALANGQSNFFYFAPQSFTVNGTYTDVIGPSFSNQGTLIVSGTPVPEPSTIAMLGPALGLLGWSRRRTLG